MKIALVNPRFPKSLWDFSYCRDIDGSKFPFPPLSLATLAALTPEEHEVVICDENVSPVNLASEADIVGITGHYIQKERVYQLAKAFRNRGLTVAIGGPLVQESNLDECADHGDVVFLGEAEYTWPMFIHDFQSNSAQSVYVQDKLVNLSDSPPPRFDLLDHSLYSTAIIETSRGCPHSCEFCEIPIRLGKGSRTKSPEQVMTEIRELYRLGIDSIFIIDDNFFGNRKRAITLLSEIRQFVRSIDYRLFFTCQFTIDIAQDVDVLSLLREANFRRVFVGIETPRESSLKMIKKRQNTRVNLLDAIHMIMSHNIIVWGAFIVGFDNDDTDIFKEQLDFIQLSAIPVAMVGILQALPGTPLYERMRQEGRLRDNEAGGIRGAFNQLTHTNITPKHMSDEDLANGYRYLVRNLYDYNNFAERIINTVKLGKEYELRGRTQMHKKEVLLILRLLRYYLISTEPRRIRMFMRVITQTIIHNPHYLETVLMHLIAYKHLKIFYDQGTSAIEEGHSVE
jgi:radical SAM superfamily enzyme YgiQ (UPF0313 family)